VKYELNFYTLYLGKGKGVPGAWSPTLAESQMWQWNVVMSPAGLGPENDCDDKGQDRLGLSSERTPYINKPATVWQ
jgi:hypothetical protein